MQANLKDLGSEWVIRVYIILFWSGSKGVGLFEANGSPIAQSVSAACIVDQLFVLNEE